MTDDKTDTITDTLTGQPETNTDQPSTVASEETTNGRDEDELYPIDSKWFVLGFYVVLLAWVVYLLLQTRGWVFEDRLLPHLFGPPVLALILIQIAKILFPGLVARLTPDTDSEETFRIDTDNVTRSKREQQKYELVMIGWVIALPVMLYYLGFLITLPLYILLFLLYFLSSPVRAVIITVVVSVMIYVLFTELLGLRFYPGVWELPGLLF